MGSSVSSGARSLAGLRVLAVDDDAGSVEFLATILRMYGATVRTARSAREGLHLLEVWRPHALLSDIEMPEEDGYAFITQVRSLPGILASIPVIAVTGHSQPQERTRAIASGFTSYLTKPVDIEALATILQHVRP